MEAPDVDSWMELVCEDCGENVVVVRHPRGRFVFACSCSTQFLDSLDPAEFSVDSLPPEYNWVLVESEAFNPDDLP